MLLDSIVLIPRALPRSCACSMQMGSESQIDWNSRKAHAVGPMLLLHLHGQRNYLVVHIGHGSDGEFTRQMDSSNGWSDT